ncbi:glycoside hydrolase family 2 protein [Microbacterium foliorum]|uniref:beta-mannosidase n=1 Tax=Microbacterium foliorum TaxID=104336 RepID=A0A4Y5YSW4_9MICO|nr:glycoside hydrolase family 2 protein [Microbacterium foliorum]QDE35573.1 glycoside hydrolase family 2 protein [Microbacterium foliorum]
MTVSRRLLHDGWTAHAVSGPVPDDILNAGSVRAEVPGSIHTDLLAAGSIPDPYLDENEKTQSWIGLTDWTYRTSFEWSPSSDERHELVFSGLDTVASVSLNGEEIATVQNMHRTHRVDVTSALREGENELEIAFRSPIRAADAASLELGARPHANHHPYNAIRKMACSFGWDWGIDTTTSGIWRPVALESWSGPRLRDAVIFGDLAGVTPRVRASASVDDAANGTPVRLSVAGTVLDGEVHEGLVRLDGDVPAARLWWPRGHGDQPLYDATLELLGPDGAVDRHDRRIGFRSVETRLEEDAAGVGFTVLVNDKPIEIRGANWIPDDAFPHRVDRQRYAARLEQAEFAGLNLIRVWGGGIYESDDFFAECDERGLLTWQDFLFACAAYAEEDPLRSEIEFEAKDAVTRLASHPSLIILNGNNENIWGRQDWNWEGRLDGRTWGAGYYYDVLPAVVEEIAPHIAYTPGSPFSPDPDERQNAADRGTMHVWDVWNEKDWTHYRAHRPRFVSEFGWQGPPTWSTLTRAVGDDPLTPESPGMVVHQKAIKGNDKLTDGLVAHLPLPNDMNDWHWAMSLNQAVAVRTAIEWWRSLAPHCTGTITWQLNDCWPVTSWAAVDGDGRRKPLLFALRAANAERLATIQPSDDGLALALVNDTDEEWRSHFTIARRGFDGSVRAQSSWDAVVPARGTNRLELPAEVVIAAEAAKELIRVSSGSVKADWFFVEARDSDLPVPSTEVVARASADGWTVDVTADTIIRDLTLLVDRIDPAAETDRALVTLLPGETARFTVRGASDATPEAFADPLVLRSTNDLLVS